MTSQYVKDLITKAYHEKVTFVDLGNCGLTEIQVLAPFLEKLNLGTEYLENNQFKLSQNREKGNNFSNSVQSFTQLNTFQNLDTIYLSQTGIKDQLENVSILDSLTSLDISSNEITDAGAASISKLINLASLDIWDNRITDAGAASISKLTNLTSLDISSNQITDAGCKSISNLTNLTALNIWGNRITDAGATSISKFTNLTSLNISSNEITDAEAASISKLTNLTSLNISGNRITDAGAASISNLTNLTSLDISDNEITDAGGKSISKLTNLTSLDISSNQITDVGGKSISKLTNLTSLNISENQITDVGGKSISKLTNLTSLNISGNRITDAGAASISNLTNLTSLDIWGNKITAAGAASILKLTNLTSLDIGDNHITASGAASVSKLFNLTSLDIENNQITAAGAKAISKLINLTSLNIRDNQITDAGATSISKLINLTSLNISENQITDAGGKSISKLTNLTSLDIWVNEITDAGATSISKLTNLASLYIYNNRITDAGATSISKLTNLTSLDISSNEITDAGVAAISKLSNLTLLHINNNQITDAGAASISKLTNLTSLDISRNEIISLQGIESIIKNLTRLASLEYDIDKIKDIPREIGNNVKALRAYFVSHERIANTLVKMILIGNTTAGKSSLADFLVTKQYEEGRKSTHGIKLWRWKTGNDENALQVNIWDFGGQDYYHTTHNLFLEDKTIFLLLQTTLATHLKQEDADTKQYLPQNYWLANIRSITSPDSAVWYIQSKSDTEPITYLDTVLVNRYNVSRQYKISVKQACKEEPYSQNDFDYFRNNLLHELQSLAKIELPASWVEIRDKHLPEWRKSTVSLVKTAFKNQCEQALQDKQNLLHDLTLSWNGLLPYLKGCGEIISFEKGSLQDTIFLSAEKLTEGIYMILSQKALDNKGEFTLIDLQEVDPKNGALYLQVLLAFEIIFEKQGNTGIYVAPQYLPENPHTKHFQQLIKVAFVIHFPDYMSRSLITKFLVKYAGKSEDNYYWRYGAFFKMYGLNVFVRIDADQQKVYVHVEDGKNKFTIMKELFLFFALPPKSFLKSNLYKPPISLESLAEYSMQHPRKKELPEKEAIGKVPEEIELSLNDIDFACVKDLREAIELRAYKIKSRQGGYIEFNAVLHQLLNTNSTMPKKIFLSYSHKDEEYKKELDTHFAALKRSGKVETWQDRKLIAGDDWDKSIEEALFNSDIALLLLSPDFMASDYIWNVEIPKAIDRGVTIVPIFVRPCDFKESVFEIYKKQGLPADAKWIVSSKNQYRDEAYLGVVEGMKKLLG